MQFWKVQALGNDFILFDDRSDQLDLTARAIRELCDRNFGIGADGVLIVRSPATAEAEYEMVYYNADGSLAEMCGNGIRCFAKFLHDHALTTTTSQLPILTGAGVKRVDITVSVGKVSRVRVNMGPPRFSRAEIPMGGEGEAEAVAVNIQVNGDSFTATAVSMGNPHCVIFVDSLERAAVTTAGPLLENHRLFPHRTNVQFVEVLSPTEVRARIWERGVGETLASGTSSCAILAAGVRNGLLERRATVHLRGGDLDIEWEGDATDSGDIYMTGPAEEVFGGEIDLSALETEDK